MLAIHIQGEGLQNASDFLNLPVTWRRQLQMFLYDFYVSPKGGSPKNAFYTATSSTYCTDWLNMGCVFYETTKCYVENMENKKNGR